MSAARPAIANRAIAASSPTEPEDAGGEEQAEREPAVVDRLGRQRQAAADSRARCRPGPARSRATRRERPSRAAQRPARAGTGRDQRAAGHHEQSRPEAVGDEAAFGSSIWRLRPPSWGCVTCLTQRSRPRGVLSARGQAAARHPARRARPVRVALARGRCRDRRRCPRGRAAGDQAGRARARRGGRGGRRGAALRLARRREARQRARRPRGRPGGAGRSTWAPPRAASPTCLLQRGAEP